ncbi:MAG TPA: hypothetical protein VHN79_09085 [Lacunisphaera sp.]|nr:hypothetical protein [Lacunisphaera sp.]
MNPIRLPRLLSTLLLAVALGSSFLTCGAQDQSAPQRDPYTISIDFGGGPLSKLVASLNADKAAKLSVIQSAGLDPALPAFSVRDARIESVIGALGRILQTQGYMLDPIGPNLAVLSRIPQQRGQGFASLPLGDKLEGGEGKWTVEEIIAAIQLGCEFANSDGKPSSLRFKYHPATKLLFAAGSEQEIDIAHRVFGSLPGKPSRYIPAVEKK